MAKSKIIAGIGMLIACMSTTLYTAHNIPLWVMVIYLSFGSYLTLSQIK